MRNVRTLVASMPLLAASVLLLVAGCGSAPAPGETPAAEKAETVPPAAVTGVAAPEAPAAQAAEAPAEPGVFLSFVDVEGGSPVNVEYRVYAAGNHEEQLIWENGDSAALALKDGDYDLLVAWDAGELWVAGIEVHEQERLEREIALDAGRLKAAFLDVANGKPQKVEYRIYPAGKHDEQLLWEAATEFEHLLRGGAYDLLASWEGGERWFPGIEVASGAVRQENLVLRSGELHLRFLDERGGSPTTTEFMLYPAGTRGAPLIWSNGTDETLRLTEGAYDLLVLREGEEQWLESLEVEAGRSTSVEVVPET